MDHRIRWLRLARTLLAILGSRRRDLIHLVMVFLSRFYFAALQLCGILSGLRGLTLATCLYACSSLMVSILCDHCHLYHYMLRGR